MIMEFSKENVVGLQRHLQESITAFVQNSGHTQIDMDTLMNACVNLMTLAIESCPSLAKRNDVILSILDRLQEARLEGIDDDHDLSDTGTIQ